MNRVKLSITNDEGQTLCKIGTSIAEPKGGEYSDKEVAVFLRELSRMFSVKEETDEFLDGPSIKSWESEPMMTTKSLPFNEEEDERLKRIAAKWSFLFDGTHNERVPTTMLIESQETPLT